MITPEGARWRYWRGDATVNELRGDATQEVQLTWLLTADQPAAELASGEGGRLTLLAGAIGGSVLVEADSGVRPVAYAPHGHRPGQDATGGPIAQPAFNGEMRDAASGCYLLGARHHRPYSPTLGMFLAPDRASPFGAGGLNALSYCAGDPINRTDPTGHFWKWIVAGIAVVAAVATLGVLAAAGAAALTASAVVGAVLVTTGAGLEVAAALVKDETLSTVLGVVGAVLGIAGGVAAGAAVAKGAASIKARGARFLSRLGSGRGGQAASRARPLSGSAGGPVAARTTGGGPWRAPQARELLDLTGSRFSRVPRRPASLGRGVEADGLVPGRFARSGPRGPDQPRSGRPVPRPPRPRAAARRVRFDPHVEVREFERVAYPDAFIRETKRIPAADPGDLAQLLGGSDPADDYIRIALSMDIKGRPV
jgi:RHS repeat-associated protein